MMRGDWNPGWFDGWERHMDGVGITWMVLMIVLWAVVIVALVFGIRALVLHSRRNHQDATALEAPTPTAPTAGPGVAASPPAHLLTILEERYARGEIDRDEFLQRKQDLGLS